MFKCWWISCSYALIVYAVFQHVKSEALSFMDFLCESGGHATSDILLSFGLIISAASILLITPLKNSFCGRLCGLRFIFVWNCLSLGMIRCSIAPSLHSSIGRSIPHTRISGDALPHAGLQWGLGLLWSRRVLLPPVLGYRGSSSLLAALARRFWRCQVILSQDVQGYSLQQGRGARGGPTLCLVLVHLVHSFLLSLLLLSCLLTRQQLGCCRCCLVRLPLRGMVFHPLTNSPAA